MCGIVAGVAKKPIRDFLINGLYKLDYRGYDSAGIGVIDKDDNIRIYKCKGSVDNLDALAPKDLQSCVGIGHTRWATHGVPTDVNSHPQLSNKGLFAIVHNGVIENFSFIKSKLIAKGYNFNSQTDTEVIANLIEYYYEIERDVLTSLRLAIQELKGSYALAILFKKDPKRIYFMKNRAPLLIGVGKNKSGHFVCSDAVPMIENCDKFVDLKDYRYGYVTENDFFVYKEGVLKEVKYTEKSLDTYKRCLNGYPNYMLKEIEESPSIIKRICDNYFQNNEFTFDKNMIKHINEADAIIIIGCGTSYHAGLIGKSYFSFANKECFTYIASEWAYYPEFHGKKPVFILISQSGETADVIKCQDIINARGNTIIALTNVKDSTIDRNATYSCLLYAGLEVAVASTKVFIAQVSVLALLTGAISHSNKVINHMVPVFHAINTIISQKEIIKKIAESIVDIQDVFYIGRGIDYMSALESSLKLKEITYIHSEAYPAGELKHGPIALIDERTVSIGFISDYETDLATRANFLEINARKGRTICVSSASLAKQHDDFVVEDVKLYLSPLVKVVFGQYLSYYVALLKGLNIDKPRNLAKSVTVE